MRADVPALQPLLRVYDSGLEVAAGLHLIDDVALIIEVKPAALTFPGC